MPSWVTLSRQAASVRARVDRMAPVVRRDVMRAIERLRARVSVERVLEAIERGDDLALAGLMSRLGHDLQPAIETLKRAFAVSAGVAVINLTPGHSPSLQITRSFKLTSPDMVQAAQQSAARFVTGVVGETRDAIRRVIVRAFLDGLPPRKAARLIKPLIGLTERGALAVLNLRQRLIRAGASEDEVNRQVRRYTERLLRRRAVTIARTETIQASVDGQIAAWRRAQDKGLLSGGDRMRWIITVDDRLCPFCRQMVGPRALAPIGGTFATPLGPRTGPPMHPNCRCAVVLDRKSLSARAAA